MRKRKTLPVAARIAAIPARSFTVAVLIGGVHLRPRSVSLALISYEQLMDRQLNSFQARQVDNLTGLVDVHAD